MLAIHLFFAECNNYIAFIHSHPFCPQHRFAIIVEFLRHLQYSLHDFVEAHRTLASKFKVPAKPITKIADSTTKLQHFTLQITYPVV